MILSNDLNLKALDSRSPASIIRGWDKEHETAQVRLCSYGTFGMLWSHSLFTRHSLHPK
jgi:hypothetical protein